MLQLFKVALGLGLGLELELGLGFEFDFEFPKFPTLNCRRTMKKPGKKHKGLRV